MAARRPARRPARRRRLPVAACAALLAVAACARPAADAPPAPVLDLRARTPEYLGPGRDDPPPAGLREVRIALFGPTDAASADTASAGTAPADGIDAWRGASMALDEANAAGGCAGLPFRLLGAWSESPWGSGTADLAKLVHAQGVWAVVGGVDGTTTHLAEQVAVKVHLAVVSPGGTDPGVNFTNVAWMFTLPATDDRIAPVIADAVLQDGGAGPWAVVATNDRDGRVTWRAVQRTLAARRAPSPVLHLTIATAAASAPSAPDAPRAPDCDGAVRDVAASGARAVLVLAAARDAGRIVRSLRAAGFGGLVVGGAPAGRRPFLDAAGDAAEGVVFPLLFDPQSPAAAGFVRTYEERWGSTPDFLAAHAYDAVRLVADAARRSVRGTADGAGPNRALLRDALVALAPWQGVTGTVTWDATGRCERTVVLGVWRAGRAARR